ncbi:hypothetical protein ACEPAH_3278 [Sanghuangporus vaninii]
MKQLFFLLSILRELLYLLLSVARGSLSLEDAHVWIQAMHSDYGKAPETDRCETPISPSPDIKGNLSTSNGSDPIVESPNLMGSVRILCRAIVQRDVKAVSRILEAAPFLVGKRHEGGWFPLHAAVLSGDIEIVKFIISCPDTNITSVYKSTGASVDIGCELGTHGEDTSGATALHFACMVDNAEIIHLLVECGAFFEHEDDKKRVPIEYFNILQDLEPAVVFRDLYLKWKRHEELFKGYNDVDDLAQVLIRDEFEVFEYIFTRLLNVEAEKRREAEAEMMEDEKISHMEAESYRDSTSQCKFSEGDAHAGIDCLPSKVHMDSLLSLEDEIGAKLVGQRGPIHLVANAIRLRESGWVDPDRPLTILFLGSSGVGKTELAKQLALYLHGKDGKATNKGQTTANLEKAHGFVRIDMSEFQEGHTVLNLIGAPKSYMGYEDGGRITDSKDGTIFCKDAIFIMTSNIAAETIKEAAPALRQEIARSEEGRFGSCMHIIQDFTRSIRPELMHHLERDEFIGRIDQIVVFLPLSQEEIKVAVHRELETWRKRSEEKHKISLTWTDDVVEKLAESYDVNYGVRSVVNEVQRIAVQLVADAYIRGHISEHWRAELTVNEVGDIVMNARPRF